MRNNLLSIISIIFYCSLGFSKETSVAGLLFFDSQGVIQNRCSGTIIKTNSLCTIITNAHCFNSRTESVKIIVGESQLHSKQFIVDDTRDLAGIKISQNDNLICKSLDVFDSHQQRQLIEKQEYDLSRQVSTSFKSLGYINDKLTVYYSRDFVWPTYGYSLAKKVPTSLSGLKYLIELPFLQMHNGMSGGPVYNLSGLVGIKKSFIPYQNTTQIIPLSEIFNFIIKNQNNKSLISSENNRSKDGGENSGTNGGDDPLIVDITKTIIDKLLEPDEGIEIDKGHLLAIGNIQIDGKDDYQLAKNNPGQSIFSGSNELLNSQALILKRVFPKFSYTQESLESGVNLISIADDLNKILYTSNPTYSMRVDFSGNQRIADLEFNISNYNLYPVDRASLTPTYSAAAKQFKFKFELSADAKEIRVTDDEKNRYTCENIFYFKIICKSRGAVNKNLSFSRSRSAGDKIRFRYTVQSSDKYIINYYGSLGPHE